jgi:hypothetical protein
MSFFFFSCTLYIMVYSSSSCFPFFEEEEFYLNDGVRLFC